MILSKVEFDTDDNVNHLIMKLPTYVIESQCQNSAAPPRPGTEELICGGSIWRFVLVLRLDFDVVLLLFL